MAKVVMEGQRKDKLKHLPLSEIIVGDRFRKDFGDMEGLIESIRDKGIIQPVSVDEGFNLLAGGRRVRAAQELGLDTVPAIIRPHVDAIDSREIELLENVYREDFTWQERASLINEIDTLKKASDPNWSSRKTAEFLDRSIGGISEQIQIAKALQVLPELGDQKSAKDALKILKKMEESAITSELRRRQTERMERGEETFEGGKHVENGFDGLDIAKLSGVDKGIRDALRVADSNYHIGSVFDGLEGMKENSMIDLIECDPPYGISLENLKASKDSPTSNVKTYNEIHEDVYPQFLDTITKELYRVAGKNCWLVFWYGPTWSKEVLAALKAAGWAVDDIPAIWVKKHGQTMQPERYFARCYEPFYLCRKGNPVMHNRGHSNVFEHSGVSGSKRVHPTERPVPLLEDLMETLLGGHGTAFVPFLGSGATLRACYNQGIRGFGFDLSGEYKDRFMLAVEEDTRRLFAQEGE